MPDTALTNFAHWLQERCDQVAEIEKKAQHVLQENNDSATYREYMLKKARLLEALPDEAEGLLAALPAPLAAEAATSLEQFATSAARALSIGSVFYMSALLYPDDHKKGQPNNLELFAAAMAARTKA